MDFAYVLIIAVFVVSVVVVVVFLCYCVLLLLARSRQNIYEVHFPHQNINLDDSDNGRVKCSRKWASLSEISWNLFSKIKDGLE